MNKQILHAVVVVALSLSIPANSYAFSVGDLLPKSKAKDATAEDISKIQKDAESFAQTKPEQLKPFFKNLWAEGERNAVLNFDYLGLAAMEIGEFSIAKAAFDQSILRIDAIYAGDENAEKAKSLWNEEKVKDFKGEPYERSMAYYYRGL